MHGKTGSLPSRRSARVRRATTGFTGRLQTYLTFMGLAIATLSGGCATPITVTHLYGGKPLPLAEVAQLEGTYWGHTPANEVPADITAVDGKKVVEGGTYAVLPGTHTVTAFGNAALGVVLQTGISTTPEMRTTKGWRLSVTSSSPGKPPVTIDLDDKRLLQARQDLEINTMRTVSFTAEAGRKYAVHCELTKDFKPTERGVWIDEIASSKAK